MNQAYDFNPLDDSERRLFERRKFSYSNHIPERRSGKDRRRAPRAEQRPEGTLHLVVSRKPNSL